jgi:hypothetical protein
METKEEINKKKGNFEQLDLVDTVKEGEKINRKRWIISLLLIVSVGLSFAFWFFRDYSKKEFSFSWPSFNISLFDKVKKEIKLDPNSWSLCFFDLVDQKLIYSLNCADSQPPAPVISNTKVASSILPEGLTISESLDQKNDSINYLASIISPRNQFILSVKIFGSGSLENSLKTLTKVIEILYWRWTR